MKLRFVIILVMIFIATGVSSVFSAEITKQKPALMLSDVSTDFPILKNLFVNGFFKNNIFTCQFVLEPGMNDQDFSDGKDLRLISESKKSKDMDLVLFNIFFYNSIKQKILISWEVPADKKRLQKASIQTIVELSINAVNSTITEALVQDSSFFGLVNSMDVKYKDNGNNTEIDGYDLYMRTGFSNTHRFFRTFAELCVINSIGVANYWINKEANMEDWRYKYTWEDAKRRFRDGWSYDTNAFRTNTLYHFYSGAIYYSTARSNDYGIPASAAWAFAGSFIWENFGEWREKTSANDMLFTSFGGVMLGEALRQSSIYVERCLDYSVYGSILAFVLDPMRVINRALDRSFSSSYKVNIIFVNPATQAIMEKSR
jgi:hypothetical protein